MKQTIIMCRLNLKAYSIQKLSLDGNKIFPTLRLLNSIDEGKAPWIPQKYKDGKGSEQDKKVEEAACALAFGIASDFMEKDEYQDALLNINASLLSTYIKNIPKYESRLLKLQAMSWIGIKEYAEAKKSILWAMDIYTEDTDNDYPMLLNMIDKKLGIKTQVQK